MLLVRGRSRLLIRDVSPALFADVPLAERPNGAEDGEPDGTAEPYFLATLAGLIHAIGLRFAGSADRRALDVACRVLKYLTSTYPSYYKTAPEVRRGLINVHFALMSTAIAIGLIMAGTGDLDALKALRPLHNCYFGHDSAYGFHMAVHMAIGFVFMGATRFSFSADLSSTAMLFLSTFPVWPASVNDNRYHMQVYRHFYLAAARPRCLVTRDAVTEQVCSVPVTVHMASGEAVQMQSPCLLPDLSLVSSVSVCGERYWGRVLIQSNKDDLELLRGARALFVMRRSGCSDYAVDPTGALSLAQRLPLPLLPAVSAAADVSTLTGLDAKELLRLTACDPCVQALPENVVGAFAELDGGAGDASFALFMRAAVLMSVARDSSAAIFPLVALFRQLQSPSPAAVFALQCLRALLRSVPDADAFAAPALLRMLADRFDETVQLLEPALAAEAAGALSTMPSPTIEFGAAMSAVMARRRVPPPTVVAAALEEAKVLAESGVPAKAVAPLVLVAIGRAGARVLPHLRDVEWMLKRAQEGPRRK